MKICLIIGEMISNSFNQALEGGSGKLMILNLKFGQDVSDKKRKFYFFYYDNGKGLPPEVDLRIGDIYGLSITFSIIKCLHSKPTIAGDGSFGIHFEFFDELVN